MVVAVGGRRRDRGEWRRLPARSPREVVLPGSLAACQTRADARVFRVPGEYRDPHCFNASSRNESAGKYNATLRDESAGEFHAPSRDKSAGKSGERGRPSQATVAGGMALERLLDPPVQGMRHVMVGTPPSAVEH